MRKICFIDKEADTKTHGCSPGLVAQLLIIEAKIETQEMNHKVNARVVHNQPSNLSHKVWVADCVSENGCSNILHVSVSAV